MSVNAPIILSVTKEFVKDPITGILETTSSIVAKHQDSVVMPAALTIIAFDGTVFPYSLEEILPNGWIYVPDESDVSSMIIVWNS